VYRMTLHRTTPLLNEQVSIEVRDRGFALGALDGVLGWFHYVNATPCPAGLERRWRELGAGDPQRFARGWAIDAAAEMLEAAGARDYLIETGTDARMTGGGRRLTACAGEFELGADELALATYDDPAGDATAITVVGPELAGAVARATSARRDGPAPGYEWVALLAGGRVQASAGFRALCPLPRRSVRTRPSRQASRPSRPRFAPA
jgi:hypothetical protein